MMHVIDTGSLTLEPQTAVGRGLARQAVEATLSELVEHYQVRNLTAVFKRNNLRSMRLLERLGNAKFRTER